MIQLLDEAINKVKVLSEAEQERIALLIMKEISAPTKKKGILSKLKQIKIQATEDFSQTVDLYLNSEK